MRLLDRDCNVPRQLYSIDPDYLGTGIATFVVQTIFFVLRLSARVLGVGRWGWDDHICIVAYVSFASIIDGRLATEPGKS